MEHCRGDTIIKEKFIKGLRALDTGTINYVYAYRGLSRDDFPEAADDVAVERPRGALCKSPEKEK